MINPYLEKSLQITYQKTLNLRNSPLNQLKRLAGQIVACPFKWISYTKTKQVVEGQKPYYTGFNGKLLLFERNISPSQQIITCTSNTDKHRGFDFCSSTARNLFL